jgi:acyl carrier protein phosphodiesterase
MPNLLAHLHLGDGLPPVQAAGNFLADYCRESDSPDYAAGVRLHQAIDAFADSHPLVRPLRPLFTRPYRRFAGILCDLAFDHFLARSWEKWVPEESLPGFVDRQFDAMLRCADELPPPALATIKGIREGNWLLSYGETAGIRRAIARIVSRRPALRALTGGEEAIVCHESELNQAFSEFYPQLIAHAKTLRPCGE